MESPTVDRRVPVTSRDDVVRLARQSATLTLPVAGRCFGLGSNMSYELARRGEFPCRVLRMGRKLRVPSADVLAALGITLDVE